MSDRPLCEEKVPVAIGVLEERIRGLGDTIARLEVIRDKSVALALSVTEHRLDELNNAHAEARRVNSETLVAMSKYVENGTHLAREKDVDGRLGRIEGDLREWKGKSFWPTMLASAALVAAVGALVGLVFKG